MPLLRLWGSSQHKATFQSVACVSRLYGSLIQHQRSLYCYNHKNRLFYLYLPGGCCLLWHRPPHCTSLALPASIPCYHQNYEAGFIISLHVIRRETSLMGYGICPSVEE